MKLTTQESKLLDVIGDRSLHWKEIAEALGVAPGEVVGTICDLVAQGYLEHEPQSDGPVFRKRAPTRP